MKKSILLLLINIILFYRAHSQTAPIVKDTVGYLKKIEALKSNFIGHPFSKLLTELKLGIVSFTPIMSNPSDVTKEPSTIFMFLVPTNAEDYNYPYISIIWQSALDFNQSAAIAGGTSPFGKWIERAKINYQDAIVSDIIIRGARTNRPPPPGGWADWNGWATPDKKKANKPKTK